MREGETRQVERIPVTSLDVFFREVNVHSTGLLAEHVNSGHSAATAPMQASKTQEGERTRCWEYECRERIGAATVQFDSLGNIPAVVDPGHKLDVVVNVESWEGWVLTLDRGKERGKLVTCVQVRPDEAITVAVWVPVEKTVCSLQSG